MSDVFKAVRDEIAQFTAIFDAARAKSPPLDAAYLAVEAKRLAATEAAFERGLPLQPRHPLPVVDLAGLTLDLSEMVDGQLVTYRFKPQRDMSGWEAATLFVRLDLMQREMRLGRQVTGVADWLVANGLMRHFEVV